MNFDEFWVRVDLVKFDIQDRNKQRVLVYFRTLSVHIHIARVLQPAPCSMPLRSALLSSNCAKIGIRNANVFPEPGSEMVRDGQRWSEVVRSRLRKVESKSNAKRLFPPNHSLVLGQLWLFVLLPVFAMPIKSRPAAAQQSSNRSSAAASIHERSLCKSSEARSKVGKVTPSIIKIYKVMFTSIAYSNDF